MSEQAVTETAPEREILNIDGKQFFMDSITENGSKIIENIKLVDGEIQRLQLSTSIAGEAKNSIFAKLVEELVNFEAVPVVEEAEAEVEVATEAK